MGAGTYTDPSIWNYFLTKPPERTVALPAPARDIFATGGGMTCALLSSELWCWGDTRLFQFADGTTQKWIDRMVVPWGTQETRMKGAFASTLPAHPIKLPKGCKPTSASVSFNQICVSCSSGCAECWGGEGTSWAPSNQCFSF